MDGNKSLLNTNEKGNDDTKSLQVVAKNLQTAIASGSNESLQAVDYELKRRPGLFGIMFPGRILKENEELTVQNMKDMYQIRQSLLNAWVNVQVELTNNEGQMIIKSKLQGYEGELSHQAMQIQADLTEFSQKKLAEIQDTFARSRATFAERIDKQTKEAEKYKDNAFLYKNLQENLDKEIEMFFSTISDLLNGFKDSLKNKLTQDRPEVS
jgi:hypothetical protein